MNTLKNYFSDFFLIQQTILYRYLTTKRYAVCLIQNLYFQGFETPKEYIASQGKFYLNKNIFFLIQCITTCMYVVDRCLFLDLKM